MPHDKTPVPTLDITRIDFPTDHLTIGHLRRLQPDPDVHSFAAGDLEKMLEVGVMPSMDVEQTLAQKAFAQAAGQPDPGEDRLDLIRMLNDEYRRLKLSTGIHQTRQLVRDFEKAAAAQAKEYLGQSRG